MYELSFKILCFIGAIYLFHRVTIFLKTLFQLIWKFKKAADKSTLTKF